MEIFSVKSAIENGSTFYSGGFKDGQSIKSGTPSQDVAILGRNSWKILPFKESIFAHSMVITNTNQLMILGGHIGPLRDNFDASRQNCYIYENCQWKFHSSMIEPRLFSVAVSMPHGIYVFGGLKHRLPSGLTAAKMEELKFKDSTEFLPIGQNDWQLGPKIPGLGGLYGAHGVAISPNEIIITGGLNTGMRILKLNVLTNEWCEGTLTVSRFDHSSVFFKDMIIVTGGSYGAFAGDKYISNDTEILSITHGTVRQSGDLNIARRGHGMSLMKINGNMKVIAFGGWNSDKTWLSTVEVFDEISETWTISKSLRLPERQWRFAYCHKTYDFQ